MIVKCLRRNGFPSDTVATLIQIDQLPDMAERGQYIYIYVLPYSVTGLEDHKLGQPLFKFNNGFDGGSPGVLFDQGYEDHPKGLMFGMTEAVLLPVINSMLADGTAE